MTKREKLQNLIDTEQYNRLIESCDKNDWFTISSDCVLSEEFMRKFKKELYWECISRY